MRQCTTAISFDDLRRFLLELGFKEMRAPSALVFRHSKDELFFRLYDPGETVNVGDLVSTRKFLDFWGLVDAGDFDAFLHQAKMPA